MLADGRVGQIEISRDLGRGERVGSLEAIEDAALGVGQLGHKQQATLEIPKPGLLYVDRRREVPSCDGGDHARVRRLRRRRCHSSRASAYEDAVLALLPHHGARVLYRGRRAPDQDPSLPLEVHLLWFPSREALDQYLVDDRRLALLEEYGEVFTLKQAVELDAITPAGRRRR